MSHRVTSYMLTFFLKPRIVGAGLLITLYVLFLVACGGSAHHKKSEAKTYTVHAESISQKLYFTGTIKPLREYTITSPMEAVVQTMPFHFGQFVKKDQVVFTLNSAELQKQYNETLTEYLKAKDSYTIARSKFTGTEDLWESGLLAKNNYLSEKSNLNTARMNFMQSAGKLSELLEKTGDDLHQNVTRLSFSEFDKVRIALAGKHNLIELKSPGDGVLLYPPKTNDDKSSRITVGSSTKAGEVLGLIGDMSGIGVEIDIPEVDIDKITVGMPAIIHGVAFAAQELKGQLLVINPQASSSASGSLPSFIAIVEVKSLTPKQQQLLRVGMSASVELVAESSDKLLVPIAAIKQKKGQSIVRVIADGVVSDRVVVTGAARSDKVVIDSGLTSGEVVVYD